LGLLGGPGVVSGGGFFPNTRCAGQKRGKKKAKNAGEDGRGGKKKVGGKSDVKKKFQSLSK